MEENGVKAAEYVPEKDRGEAQKQKEEKKDRWMRKTEELDRMETAHCERKEKGLKKSAGKKRIGSKE